MAGQTVWGIDIGQCALKAIKLTYDSKQDRAVAVAFDYVEHPKILSQPDAEPDELIKAAIEKFAERNPLDGAQVLISVPGQAGLSRFVKLPPVEPKKVPDIVNFEAKQQIPFALTDVVWDYQRIGAADDEEDGGPVELEVGIFAIRKDSVRKHLEPFQSKGIDVHTVQLAPVALYNYAAFDIIYHAHANKAAEGQEGEAVAEEEEGDAIVILDIGADKTDVVITDGDSIWLRNLPIGGNHFTRALTKDLKLTFAKAEHLKRNATKAPDPKKLYQAMRPVFQDFVGELQRSIGFFASTHRGTTIKKIVGMGNGFRLPGLQKFLQQNLQYKVEKVGSFNGLVGDDVIKDQTFLDNVMSFSVAYGLALQGIEQTPIQTNLLPQEIRVARLIRDKKPWSLLAASVLLLGFSSVFMGNYFSLKAVSKEKFDGPANQARSEAGQYQKFNNDFKTAMTAYGAVNDRAKLVIGAKRLESRELWLRAMQMLSLAIPPRSPVDVRDIASLEEVNIEAVRGVYFMTLGEWFGKLDAEDLQSMAQADRQAPPGTPGWVFQIRGFTFNKGTRIHIQDSILKNLQSEPLRKLGVSHACLAEFKFNDNWTPSQSGTTLSFRDIAPKGKGSSSRSDTLFGTSSGGNRIALSPASTTKKDDEFKELPADMREYMKTSLDLNKQAGNTNKIQRTDFIIEFAWNPDYKPPEVPPMGTEGAPGTPPGAPGTPAAGMTPTPPGMPTPATPVPPTGVPATPAVVPAATPTPVPPPAPPVTAGQPPSGADDPPQ
jgi:type IV pilus assembly protein PilM